MKGLQHLIVALLLPLITTIGHFLPSKTPAGDGEKLLFTFFLSVPTVVIALFIKRSFEIFFFKKKKWKKTWNNKRRVLGLTLLVAIAYVSLMSFAYYYLILLVLGKA